MAKVHSRPGFLCARLLRTNSKHRNEKWSIEAVHSDLRPQNYPIGFDETTHFVYYELFHPAYTERHRLHG